MGPVGKLVAIKIVGQRLPDRQQIEFGAVFGREAKRLARFHDLVPAKPADRPGHQSVFRPRSGFLEYELVRYDLVPRWQDVGSQLRADRQTEEEQIQNAENDWVIHTTISFLRREKLTIWGNSRVGIKAIGHGRFSRSIGQITGQAKDDATRIPVVYAFAPAVLPATVPGCHPSEVV